MNLFVKPEIIFVANTGCAMCTPVTTDDSCESGKYTLIYIYHSIISTRQRHIFVIFSNMRLLLSS